MTDKQIEAAARCLHEMIYGYPFSDAVPLIRVAMLKRARLILGAAEAAA